jgi:hypothetical protein
MSTGAVHLKGTTSICGSASVLNIVGSACNPYIGWYCANGVTRLGYMRGCAATPTTSKISICADLGASIQIGTSSLSINATGAEKALWAVANSCTALYHNGIIKFKTCSTGSYTLGIHCSSTCSRSPVHCSTTAFRISGSGYRYCGGTGCGTAVDWVATSDCRIKKCIVPITSALSTVDALCGRCYEFCEDGTLDMGLVAQEVLCVEPRLVAHGEVIEEYKKYGIEDEVLSLKYDKFAGLFVEAIKELKTQNECLQNQINELKK